MGIDWRDVLLLYRHELRCALRETNIILYSFLVPALLYPQAKYLYVSSVSAGAGLLNLAAMIFSMRSIIAPLNSDAANSLVFTIPWSSFLVVLLGTVLLALTMSAGMMILASFARTFREGQAMVTPVFLLTLLPVAVLADSSLSSTAPWRWFPSSTWPYSGARPSTAITPAPS